jgi:adenylate cyclase
MEIERKFLVTELASEAAQAPATDLRQGYLALDGAVEVRVRADGGAHTLTIKGGSGLTRTEAEVVLDVETFDRLWPLTEGRRVDKRRHRLALGDDLILEVDVYTGDLAGLMTAEVEFASAADSAQWDPPAWLGRELTGDGRYANQSLATHGVPTT